MYKTLASGMSGHPDDLELKDSKNAQNPQPNVKPQRTSKKGDSICRPPPKRFTYRALKVIRPLLKS